MNRIESIEYMFKGFKFQDLQHCFTDAIDHGYVPTMHAVRRSGKSMAITANALFDLFTTDLDIFIIKPTNEMARSMQSSFEYVLSFLPSQSFRFDCRHLQIGGKNNHLYTIPEHNIIHRITPINRTSLFYYDDNELMIHNNYIDTLINQINCSIRGITRSIENGDKLSEHYKAMPLIKTMDESYSYRFPRMEFKNVECDINGITIPLRRVRIN